MKILDRKAKRKLAKHDKMLIHGLKNRLIFPYPDALFDRLRPYHLAGMPVSTMMLIIELCNGHCYDRSMLMQLAFKDCEVVHADIECLRITAGEEFAEHSFVETTEFGGGKTWVVDTSIGLVYDKNYYYKIEKPKINCRIPKEKCMQSPYVQEVIAGNFEQEKYALPLYMPFVESAVKHSNYLGTVAYREKIIEELEKFKKAVGYEAIVKEIEDDMRLMRTDPAKLDEKFQIVRDKYGREISRGGVANPYYISPEEADRKQAYYESIQDNEEKLAEYYATLAKNSYDLIQAEAEQTSILAKQRIEEIVQNPTADFYEVYGTTTEEETVTPSPNQQSK